MGTPGEEKRLKAEITEISYSTALTFELVTRFGFLTLGAPTFPSLRKEAIYKPGGDNPSVPLFLQYKLGDHIIGSASSLRGYWGVPYYRFLIHPRKKIKRQELLVRLENHGHLVYYLAPEFHTMGELFDALMKTEVLAHSTFWPPRAFGRFAEVERYTLAYKRGRPDGVLQPGNIRIEGSLKGEHLLTAIKGQFDAGKAETYDEGRLRRLGDRMLKTYLEVFPDPKGRRLAEDIRTGRDRIDARDYLSLISILLYDCYVYFVRR